MSSSVAHNDKGPHCEIATDSLDDKVSLSAGSRAQHAGLRKLCSRGRVEGDVGFLARAA